MPTNIENKINNKRIAKNTLLLYFRMLFLMLITLYTSRVILDALGVEDYGIYNVVGGFVSMFALISAALTSASDSSFVNGTDSVPSAVFNLSVRFFRVSLSVSATYLRVWESFPDSSAIAFSKYALASCS